MIFSAIKSEPNRLVKWRLSRSNYARPRALYVELKTFYRFISESSTTDVIIILIRRKTAQNMQRPKRDEYACTDLSGGRVDGPIYCAVVRGRVWHWNWVRDIRTACARRSRWRGGNEWFRSRTIGRPRTIVPPRKNVVCEQLVIILYSDKKCINRLRS